MEYFLAEKERDYNVNIAREKKTKYNSLCIRGIVTLSISLEKIIKIHVWKICLVFLTWTLGWLFLCHASSASLYFLKGELKTDTTF